MGRSLVKIFVADPRGLAQETDLTCRVLGYSVYSESVLSTVPRVLLFSPRFVWLISNRPLCAGSLLPSPSVGWAPSLSPYPGPLIGRPCTAISCRLSFSAEINLVFSRISGLLISPGLIYRPRDHASARGREAKPTSSSSSSSFPRRLPADICLPDREEGNTTVPRFSLIYRSSRRYLTKRSLLDPPATGSLLSRLGNSGFFSLLMDLRSLVYASFLIAENLTVP